MTLDEANNLINKMVSEPGKSPFDEMVIDFLIGLIEPNNKTAKKSIGQNPYDLSSLRKK